MFWLIFVVSDDRVLHLALPICRTRWCNPHLFSKKLRITAWNSTEQLCRSRWLKFWPLPKVSITNNWYYSTVHIDAVLVKSKILLLSLETSDVSVCVSPNGWAWLVHGRRLVVWRYSKASSANVGSYKWLGPNCRELTLPPSDLAHSAKLVNNDCFFWVCYEIFELKFSKMLCNVILIKF